MTSRDSKPCVEVGVGDGERKTFSPEEVSAMILAKMKDTAEVITTAVRHSKRAIRYVLNCFCGTCCNEGKVDVYSASLLQCLVYKD